jgi:hypothetical protein
MQIWTVNEQDCYDAGFEHGKDYWVPLERQRIIDYLNRELSNPMLETKDIIAWLNEDPK